MHKENFQLQLITNISQLPLGSSLAIPTIHLFFLVFPQTFENCCKGRRASVVVWWWSSSIAIGRVRSCAISSWRWRRNLAGVATISVDSKVRSSKRAYDSLNGVMGNILREGGKDSAESQVGQEVQDLGLEVEDKSSQHLVIFIIGGWLLSIEVVECDIGAVKGDGIADGGGVIDDGTAFQELREVRGFKEGGEEEVPLESGECEELGGGRHEESCKPLVYFIEREQIKGNKQFIHHPFSYRKGTSVGWLKSCVSTGPKAFASRINSDH